MSKPREKMQVTVELMRRGAVMMKEPCPDDNGVQLRYKGKIYCTNHDDLEAALLAKEISYGDVAAGLRDLLLVKLKENMNLLENEQDPEAGRVGRIDDKVGGPPEQAGDRAKDLNFRASRASYGSANRTEGSRLCSTGL